MQKKIQKKLYVSPQAKGDRLKVIYNSWINMNSGDFLLAQGCGWERPCDDPGPGFCTTDCSP